MNTVVCVLKSGTWKPWRDKDYSVTYTPRHVQWLRDQFASQVAEPHRFVCLTDIEVPGVETRPLRDGLPGWWSKLEIFREFRKALYVDLDTVILRDIGPYVFHGHKFTVCASLSRKTGINSSVMSWDGDYGWLYEKFIDDRERVMREYTQRNLWGDQDFIRDSMDGRFPVTRFQDRTPGLVISYKHDIMNRGKQALGGRLRTPLRGTWWNKPRIICFHGKPKYWELEGLPWLPKLCAA